MPEKSVIAILFLSLLLAPCALEASESGDLKEIRTNADRWDRRELEKRLSRFLSSYPKSRHRAEVMFIGAEREEDPEEALERHREILEKFPGFSDAARVRRNICRILALQGNWERLLREAEEGVRIYSPGKAAIFFHFHSIYSAMRLGELDRAVAYCDRLIEDDHSYLTMARVLLIRSYISRRMTGFSRDYAYRLREIIIGFDRAHIEQSTLLLLGDFYMAVREYNRAYSALLDLVKRYPRSPEARVARDRIRKLKSHKPEYVKYIPERERLDRYDTINIHPEIEMEEDRGKERYAVSIGPLLSLKSAREIAETARKFGTTRIVQVRRGYLVITGSDREREKALRIRVRLAEEFGINGHLIRLEEQDGRQYIYGE